MAVVCLIILTILTYGYTIPIDNGVEGVPEIECSADSISVNFNTKNDFQGHIYVKGRFNEVQCRNEEKGRRTSGIKLTFSSCGTKRDRSLNPKGIYVTNTVVITFHPQFLTKVDRAYTVQCFYMESDKTVSQNFEVSDLTTAFRTQSIPMPACRYDILDGSPTGSPVKFATIGQQVYHKWVCETQLVDTFCAIVHSCLVDDGAGNRIQLLNEKGCALDKYLLNNLEYQSDLMAGHEAHVFKYADKPALIFQCQITILIKEPNQPCPRPQCPEPGGPLTLRPPATPPPLPYVPATSKSPTAATDSSNTRAYEPPPAYSYGGNVTERASRSVEFRHGLTALAAKLFRRIRSIPEAHPIFVDSDNAIGTWDVSSQQIDTLDIDVNDDLEIGKWLKEKRIVQRSEIVKNGGGYDKQYFCIKPIWLVFMTFISSLMFLGGGISVILYLKKRSFKMIK